MRSPAVRDAIKHAVRENQKLLRIIVKREMDPEVQERQDGSKGGWEGWLQVEVAGRLFMNDDTLLSWSREICYPRSNTRCDFVMNYEERSKGGQIWVELKTRRSVRHNTGIEAWIADVDKLRWHFSCRENDSVFGFAALVTLFENDNEIAGLAGYLSGIRTDGRVSVDQLVGDDWLECGRQGVQSDCFTLIWADAVLPSWP